VCPTAFPSLGILLLRPPCSWVRIENQDIMEARKTGKMEKRGPNHSQYSLLLKAKIKALSKLRALMKQHNELMNIQLQEVKCMNKLNKASDLD